MQMFKATPEVLTRHSTGMTTPCFGCIIAYALLFFCSCFKWPATPVYKRGLLCARGGCIKAKSAVKSTDRMTNNAGCRCRGNVCLVVNEDDSFTFHFKLPLDFYQPHSAHASTNPCERSCDMFDPVGADGSLPPLPMRPPGTKTFNMADAEFVSKAVRCVFLKQLCLCVFIESTRACTHIRVHTNPGYCERCLHTCFLVHSEDAFVHTCSLDECDFTHSK